MRGDRSWLGAGRKPFGLGCRLVPPPQSPKIHFWRGERGAMGFLSRIISVQSRQTRPFFFIKKTLRKRAFR